MASKCKTFFPCWGRIVHQNRKLCSFKMSVPRKSKMKHLKSTLYLYSSIFLSFIQLFLEEKGISNVEIVRTCLNDKKLMTFWITAGCNKFFGGNIRRELINDLKLKKEKISTRAVHFFWYNDSMPVALYLLMPIYLDRYKRHLHNITHWYEYH